MQRVRKLSQSLVRPLLGGPSNEQEPAKESYKSKPKLTRSASVSNIAIPGHVRPTYKGGRRVSKEDIRYPYLQPKKDQADEVMSSTPDLLPPPPPEFWHREYNLRGATGDQPRRREHGNNASPGRAQQPAKDKHKGSPHTRERASGSSPGHSRMPSEDKHRGNPHAMEHASSVLYLPSKEKHKHSPRTREHPSGASPGRSRLPPEDKSKGKGPPVRARRPSDVMKPLPALPPETERRHRHHDRDTNTNVTRVYQPPTRGLTRSGSESDILYRPANMPLYAPQPQRPFDWEEAKESILRDPKEYNAALRAEARRAQQEQQRREQQQREQQQREQQQREQQQREQQQREQQQREQQQREQQQREQQQREQQQREQQQREQQQHEQQQREQQQREQQQREQRQREQQQREQQQHEQEELARNESAAPSGHHHTASSRGAPRQVMPTYDPSIRPEPTPDMVCATHETATVRRMPAARRSASSGSVAQLPQHVSRQHNVARQVSNPSTTTLTHRRGDSDTVVLAPTQPLRVHKIHRERERTASPAQLDTDPSASNTPPSHRSANATSTAGATPPAKFSLFAPVATDRTIGAPLRIPTPSASTAEVLNSKYLGKVEVQHAAEHSVEVSSPNSIASFMAEVIMPPQGPLGAASALRYRMEQENRTRKEEERLAKERARAEREEERRARKRAHAEREEHRRAREQAHAEREEARRAKEQARAERHRAKYEAAEASDKAARRQRRIDSRAGSTHRS
ncbi:hypothetical protein AcV7_004466 [Taiwanofungus camphoratus]|nr:hypothetical protein AcV7_004466 [Antrodia cinnamomea]